MRLLIVAADSLARAGLAALVSDLDEILLAGQISPDDHAVMDTGESEAEVVLWDLGWEYDEHMDLLMETAADSLEGGPGLVVLVPDLEPVKALWSAGIRSMLMRDASVEALSSAVGAAANNLAVLDPQFLDVLIPESAVQESEPVEELTARELEVLRLVAEGMSNRAIANELNLSEHTVKFHLNTLMGKLEVQSRTAAVVRATRLGLIAL